jgi:hypothetical protein
MKNTTLTMIAIVSLSLISGASVAESRSGMHRSDNEFLNRNLPQLSQDQTMSPTEPNQFRQQKIHERKEKDSVEKNNEQRNADGFNDNRDNRATRR